MPPGRRTGHQGTASRQARNPQSLAHRNANEISTTVPHSFRSFIAKRVGYRAQRDRTPVLATKLIPVFLSELQPTPKVDRPPIPRITIVTTHIKHLIEVVDRGER